MTKSVKASSDTLVELPADRIDLAAWLAILSDPDYRACSPGHLAAGTFIEEGTFGTVNVEKAGGHLLVHHYLADTLTANHVVMRSRDTRAYVMHTLPATIEVIWALDVVPRDNRSVVFRCTVEVVMPAFLAFVAALGLLPLFLRRHIEGETPLFARDLVHKVTEGRL